MREPSDCVYCTKQLRLGQNKRCFRASSMRIAYSLKRLTIARNPHTFYVGYSRVDHPDLEGSDYQF
jgi:hypothetical protein